ncbi:MAG: polysaccharide biosynthesis protein [Woeseia sp.]
MLIADVIGFALAVWVSAWLLYGGEIAVPSILLVTLGALLVVIPCTWYVGLYRSVVRYMGLELIVAGVKSSTVSALAVSSVAYVTGVLSAPVRFGAVYWALSLLYLLGSRYLARQFLNHPNPSREHVMVYGAGECGARLVLALLEGDTFLPVALIDDDESLHDKKVSGLVVQSPTAISRIINELAVTRVLLALPSAPRRNRQAIIEGLEKLSVHVQTMPDMNDLVSGKAHVEDIGDVDIMDLLGRETVAPDVKLLSASIKGKSVMVTGAGGSIGSELCRQILRLGPKSLVLFEISEAVLYDIDKELSVMAAKLDIDCRIVALLGSAHREVRVREVLETFGVNIVFHAAAYKHVPVVEHNLLEGIYNNIFGTLHTARAAIAANVDTFVLVSTDKAVSPTSVMGASKRFSEMILQALQDEHRTMRFCMVRFGNVLASSGSVVPLFREQIRKGGPVTVTHRDVTRYFMTIPEAAQLVIQAGAMAQGGDVFVLDMGEPIEIHNLARRMISLMGLTVKDDENPAGDIEIEFIGLRPGEKLYEELLIGTDVSATEHPHIMRASEEYLSCSLLDPLIDELSSSFIARDRDRARAVLLRAIGGYEPANGIEDLVCLGRRDSPHEALRAANS